MIDEYGNIVRKDKFGNRFDNIDKYLSNFSHRIALSWNQQDSMNPYTIS